MKNPQEKAKAEMIAQLVKKNMQGGDTKDWPCWRLCSGKCDLG
jgi:hypothetical protein